MIIRDEAPSDRAAVLQTVHDAFGQPDEGRLVQALSEAGDVVISLVAEDDGVVGQVLLSKMTAPFPALALAPISVAPNRQNTEIGSALVRAAIDRARREDWAAIFVLGDPAYYGRFGFNVELASRFSTPYAGAHFMALVLLPPLPTLVGVLRHAAAFDGLA